MSYVSIPFSTNKQKPPNLEGLLDFHDSGSNPTATGLDILSNYTSSSVDRHVLAALRYQRDRGYAITFVFNDAASQKIDNTISNVSHTVGIKQLARQESTQFTLPNAPLLSIRMKNKIVSKVVARRAQKKQNAPPKGSIKERWGINDVEINITGVLLFGNGNEYPLTEVRLLNRLIQEGQIGVQHTLLNSMGITQLIMQSIELPPTKANNQQYRIQAISDYEDYNILTQDNSKNT